MVKRLRWLALGGMMFFVSATDSRACFDCEFYVGIGWVCQSVQNGFNECRETQEYCRMQGGLCDKVY